jgi:hypothetical protein
MPLTRGWPNADWRCILKSQGSCIAGTEAALKPTQRDFQYLAHQICSCGWSRSTSERPSPAASEILRSVASIQRQKGVRVLVGAHRGSRYFVCLECK